MSEDTTALKIGIKIVGFKCFVIFYLLWKTASTLVKYFKKCWNKFFSSCIAALKIHIWHTKDLFLGNMRKQYSLVDCFDSKLFRA